MARPRVSLDKKYVCMHFNEYYSESTATGAVEMMTENSLTFLPLDDPKKEVCFQMYRFYASYFFMLGCTRYHRERS